MKCKFCDYSTNIIPGDNPDAICMGCAEVLVEATRIEGWSVVDGKAMKPCGNTHECDGDMQNCAEWGGVLTVTNTRNPSIAPIAAMAPN